MPKVLISLVTSGSLSPGYPWLYKFKTLQHNNFEVYFHNGIQVEKLSRLKNIYKYISTYKNNHNYLDFNNRTKLQYILHCLSRNLKSLKHIFYITKTFDVVYSPSSVLDLIAMPFIAKSINSKIIWGTVFDNIVPKQDPGDSVTRKLGWFFFKISLYFLKKADVIFVISSELKTYLIKKGFSASSIYVTGNAIETETISKIKRQKYSSDAVFVGRVNQTKGIYDLLKVINIVKKTKDNFILNIIGNDDFKSVQEYRQTIKKMKLSNNVKLLGFIHGPKRFQIMANSKMFLFLSQSQSESFGIALLEAVCLGLPAITYNLEPFKKIYKNNEVHMYKVGDISSVAKRVLEILKNPSTNQSGKKMINQYSWENIAKIEYQAIAKANERHLQK